MAPPTFCPFCRSKDLSTASKVITASTYWRCTACGEIWNPGRLVHRRRTATADVTSR